MPRRRRDHTRRANQQPRPRPRPRPPPHRWRQTAMIRSSGRTSALLEVTWREGSGLFFAARWQSDRSRRAGAELGPRLLVDAPQHRPRGDAEPLALQAPKGKKPGRNSHMAGPERKRARNEGRQLPPHRVKDRQRRAVRQGRLHDRHDVVRRAGGMLVGCLRVGLGVGVGVGVGECRFVGLLVCYFALS